MTRHYPDLGSASDWLNQISHAARPIRNATQIRVVTRHQYGISALVSHTSISGETSGSVAKCRLFAQASDRASLEGPRSVNSSPKKNSLLQLGPKSILIRSWCMKVSSEVLKIPENFQMHEPMSSTSGPSCYDTMLDPAWKE